MLVKLLDLLPNFTDDFFDLFQNEMMVIIKNFSDSDKEQIKTTLRKIIYIVIDILLILNGQHRLIEFSKLKKYVLESLLKIQHTTFYI